MSTLNLLIVEGNIQKDSEFFIKAAGLSVSKNLKKLILKLEPTALIKIVHPGNEIETNQAIKNILPMNVQQNEFIKCMYKEEDKKEQPKCDN